MKHLEICPVCCSGHLETYTFSREISYKNITCNVEIFQSSRCDICASEVATHAQTKQNKLININFQRAVDGLLTTTEIIRIRKKLKLSQRMASQIIGGGGNAFAKYESGATRQSLGIDNMLRALDEHPKILQILMDADEQRRALSKSEIKICIPGKQKVREENNIFTLVKDCFGLNAPSFSAMSVASEVESTLLNTSFVNEPSLFASWSL